MKFCNKCDNMYYIRLNESDMSLTNYCRHCGNEDNSTDTNIIYSEETAAYNKDIVNEYTKLDPTLPRVHNINCPSSSCITNTEPDKHEREVLYIRYDEDNMKYLYMCSTCDTVWRTDDNSN